MSNTKIRANQLDIEEILNDPSAAASELKKGSIEIATQAEVNAGSDTLRVVTPNTLSNSTLFEPADATILKDADIGVTVQGYDATILNAADITVTVAAQGHTHTGVYEPADTTILKAIITTPATGHVLTYTAGGDWVNTNSIKIETDGTLVVTTASYENLVTANNDIPNKKYVDDAIGTGIGATTLGQLIDVDLGGSPALADGHILTYDTSGSPTIWKNSPPAIPALGDLTNVILTGSPAPALNDVLTFDGNDWIHQGITATGAAGSATEIQFNTGGSFDASPNLTFDGSVLAANARITGVSGVAFLPAIGATSSAANGIGVLSTANSATGVAVRGNSSNGRGVYGFSNDTTAANYGVMGTSASSAGYGGSFKNTNGDDTIVKLSGATTLIDASNAGATKFLVTDAGDVTVAGDLSVTGTVIGVALDELSDVALAPTGSPPIISAGDVLSYVAGSPEGYWQNQTPDTGVSTLSELTDVTLSGSPATLTDGHVLTWDDATSKWVDQELPTGGEAYVNINSTGTLPTAVGTDAVSIGENAIAGGLNGVAVGKSANSTATAAIAIGSAKSYGNGSVAFNGDARGNYSFAGTSRSRARGHDDIAIGQYAYTGLTSARCIAIGRNNAMASAATDNVVIGQYNIAAQNSQVILGNNITSADVTSDVAHSVRLGTGTADANKNMLHLFSKGKLELYGDSAQFVVPSYTFAGSPVLDVPETAEDGAIVYDSTAQILKIYGGSPATWSAVSEPPAASYNWLTANNTTNFDATPTASGSDAIAIGDNATASGDDTIVMGRNASATTPYGHYGVAIGLSANAQTSSVAVGHTAKASGGGNSVAIGHSSKAYGDDSIAIGWGAYSISADQAICIGKNTSTNRGQSTNIGLELSSTSASTNVTHSVKVGYGATNANKNMLHLFSKGKLELYGDEAQFVMPNYTAGSPAALPANAEEGGVIYDQSTKSLKVYGGSPDGWQDIGASSTSSGATIQLSWKFSTNTAATDPGSKNIKFNNVTPASVTAVFINDITNNGVDASTIISALTTGDGLYIQQANDGTKFLLATLSGDPTDNTGWWTIPVTVDDSGLLLDNKKDTGVIIHHESGATSNNWLTANNGSDFGVAPSATGSRNIAIGDSATANAGYDKVAIGTNADASGYFSISIGHDTQATSTGSVAIGESAESTSGNTIAIGYGTLARSSFDIAMGRNTTTATGKNSQVAIGNQCNSSEKQTVAIGYDSDTLLANQVAIGTQCKAATVTSDVAYSVKLGYADGGTPTGNKNLLHLFSHGKLELYGTEAQFIIPNYTLTGSPGQFPANPVEGGLIYDSTAKGLQVYGGSPAGWSAVGGGELNKNWLIANNGSDFGTTPTATGTNAITIGNNATAGSNDAVSIGSNASSTGINSTAIGINSKAQVGSVAVGSSAEANVNAGVAIGLSADALADNAISIGRESNARSASDIAFGEYANTGTGSNNFSIVIGRGSSTSNSVSKGIVIGSATVAALSGQTAIGTGLTSADVTSDVAYSVKFGYGSADTNKNMLHLFSKGKLELYGDEAQFIIPNYVLTGSPIAFPANAEEGALIYDSTAKGLQVYGGSPAGWSEVGGGGLANIVEDTTPELGGNLDTGGFDIVGSSTYSVAGSSVVIQGGTNSSNYQAGGTTTIKGGSGTGEGGIGGNIQLITGATGGGAAGSIEVHTTSGATGQGSLEFWDHTNTGHTTGNYVALKAPSFTGSPIANITFALPQFDGTAGQVLSTDSYGNLSFITAGLANPLTANLNTGGYSIVTSAGSGAVANDITIQPGTADTGYAAGSLNLYGGSGGQGDVNIVAGGYGGGHADGGNVLIKSGQNSGAGGLVTIQNESGGAKIALDATNDIAVTGNFTVSGIFVSSTGETDNPYIYESADGVLSFRMGQAAAYKYVSMEADGNVAVPSATTPTDDDHLTRKDYVDTLNAKFNMQILLPVGSADTFTMLQSAVFGFTIDKAFYQTATGALTADIKIEGVSVTGLSALSITTTEGNTTASGSPLTKTAVVGDKITVVTSGGSPLQSTMVSICLECTKTY